MGGKILVRPGRIDDLDWVVDRLRTFSDFFGSRKILFGDESYVRNGMRGVIENHVLFIAESRSEETQEAEKATLRVGFIAGMLNPHIFNPHIRVLVQFFWWVDPSARGSRAGAMLLDDFVAWGKSHADWITFGVLEKTPIRDEILIKRGFQPYERAFLMEV